MRLLAHCSRPVAASLLIVIVASILGPRSSRASQPRCATPVIGSHQDSLHLETGIAFFPHRSGVEFVNPHWRDIEFMWDRLYGTPDLNHRNTLDKLAASIIDSIGSNPFKIPVSNFRLIYEYFRQGGAAYTLNPTDTTGVVIGNRDVLKERNLGGNLLSAYKPSDRSHLDVYIPNPGRGLNYGGETPSAFVSYNEDSTTSHNHNPQPANSIEVVGP